MNGRIYDPTIGRFLQADPLIQFPTHSQSYNRYSYVLNNPLSHIDPSGYALGGLINPLKKIFRAFASVPIINSVMQGLACYAGGPWGCAAYASASTYGVTGSLGASLKNGAIAFATAKAFEQIGAKYRNTSTQNINAWHGAYSAGDMGTANSIMDSLHSFGGNELTLGQIAGQIASHAAVGGVSTYLSGGKFGHGFFSAGVTKGLGTPLLDASGSNVIGGTIGSLAIGGTVSLLTGGKFSNGATTAAYQTLFNYFGDQACSGQMCRSKNKVNTEELNVIDQFLADHGYISFSVKGGFILAGALDVIVSPQGVSIYVGGGLGFGFSATATTGISAGAPSDGWNTKVSFGGGFGAGGNASLRISPQGLSPSVGIGTGLGMSVSTTIGYKWKVKEF